MLTDVGAAIKSSSVSYLWYFTLIIEEMQVVRFKGFLKQYAVFISAVPCDDDLLDKFMTVEHLQYTVSPWQPPSDTEINFSGPVSIAASQKSLEKCV